jgi:hypothetical protein
VRLVAGEVSGERAPDSTNAMTPVVGASAGVGDCNDTHGFGANLINDLIRESRQE